MSMLERQPNDSSVLADWHQLTIVINSVPSEYALEAQDCDAMKTFLKARQVASAIAATL